MSRAQEFEKWWEDVYLQQKQYPMSASEYQRYITRIAYLAGRNAGLEKGAEICKDTPYRTDSEHDDAITMYEREVIAAIREEME